MYMDLKKLLTEYLKSNKLMQLATVDKGQPWLCNVYYVADEANNIYWTSTRMRRHSKEITSDSRVAATIVHNEKCKQALQITGEVLEVSFNDVERVNKLYADKFGDKPSRLQEVLDDTPDGRAYWVLKPKTILFWDEVNFPDSPKQEVDLSLLLA